MASSITRSGAFRLAGVGLAGCVLALGGSAVVEGASGPDVAQAPSITGTLKVGQTVTASNGRYTPSDASVSYQWLRCPDENVYHCSLLDGSVAQTYKLVAADQAQRMRVALVARQGSQYDYAVSSSAGPVAALSTPTPAPPPVKTPTATPTPVKTPTATPTPARTPTPSPTPQPPVAGETPTPTPTPPPAFDVAAVPAATPVPNAGAVLHETATSKQAKMLKPFPVVRIRGRLTPAGANVTTLTVTAPRGVEIDVTCSGPSCPVRRMAKATRVTPLATFQRDLKAGTRLTITISKPGYVSKVTVVRIRRGAAPLRSDGCLYPGRKRTQRCPAA